MMFVLTSGVALNVEFRMTLAGVPSGNRLFGNSSFVTPISTLKASLANISSDLSCAFQPKRVIVPSFSLVLNTPPIPSAAR